jgi:tRNA threonylcarbamoyladenosine modification (KEOPS) complex Cgi121 subunit
MTTHVRAFAVGPDFDAGETRDKMKRDHPTSLVQTLGVSASFNERLLELLAAQTMAASSGGTLVAKKPEIDFLLRVAGTTQISKAIRKVGSKTKKPFILVVASRRRISKGIGDPEWKELARHGLSGKELDRIELGALLNASKP